MGHMIPEPNSGCWLWIGAWAGPKGYGSMGRDGKICKAYRVAYETFVGPIPPGLELDHLCRTPACINPKHLEPVTRSVNQFRRGQAITQCPRGHAYREPGVGRHGPDGRRLCRVCHRDRERARKRQAAAG